MKTGSGSFYKRMLALAVPIALQNMLSSCGSLVDTAMVARLGNVATSAVGIGSRWMLVINMITFGFCSGGSVLISQYWGAGDQKGVRRSYSLGLIFCTLAALGFNVLAACFPYQMMCIFTGEEAVRLAGEQYLRVVCFGSVPVAAATIMSMARRSVEDVRLPLINSGIAVCVNSCLNYCLIYGRLGLPDMGLRGAALATVISQIVQLLVLTLAGLRQKHFTIFGLAELKSVSRGFLNKYFRVAFPVICNETLWCVGYNLYAVIYARQGSANYAAYTLYGSIESLVFVFFIGACNACGILVGKAIGQGKREEAEDTAKRILNIFVAMAAVLGAALFAARWPILNLMGVETEYTANLTAQILAFYCCWCPLRQLNYVLVVGILRAGGDTRVAMLLDVGVTLFWSVPVTYVLAYWVKLPFLWIVCGTFIAEDLLKLPLCLWRFRSKKWIHALAVDDNPNHEM